MNDAAGTDSERLYLLGWAEQNGCLLETRGTVGFGRPAVGIVVGNGYVDLGRTKHVHDRYGGYDDQVIADGARPPDGVDDAYHKHDCLCVLAHGEPPDYEAALIQLAVWVRHLEVGGFRVETTVRRPTNAIDLAIHGVERAFLTQERKAAE